VGSRKCDLLEPRPEQAGWLLQCNIWNREQAKAWSKSFEVC